MHTTIKDLGLTDASGGCGCGAAHTPIESKKNREAVATEYLVTGMTCSHCVASVTEEVSALAGVSSVEVDLKVGGESRVIVSGAAPVDPAAVQAAIEEAGYSVVAAD